MQLAGRADIESRFARMLSNLNAEQRATLREIVGDPPDPALVPESYWREHEKRLSALLLLLLMLSATRSAVQHGLDEADAQAAVEPWASAQAWSLSRDWTTVTRERLSDAAAQLPASGAPVESAIDAAFGDARTAGLVVTEITRAAVWGGELAVRRRGGISMGDQWKTNPSYSSTGPCAICRPLDGTTRATWGLEFAHGPPAHPNCVCEILYVALGQTAGVGGG